MNNRPAHKLFDLSGKVAVVTGGAGVLCASLSRGLALEGVKVVILDINRQGMDRLASEIHQAGGDVMGVECNVCDNASIKSAARQVINTWGRVDILINGAGGNSPLATTKANLPFFDLPEEGAKTDLSDGG